MWWTCAFRCTWVHLASPGFTQVYLVSRGCTWIHSVVLDITRVHSGVLGFPWFHLGSLGFTWHHLGSLGFIRVRLGSLGITWVHFFTWFHCTQVLGGARLHSCITRVHSGVLVRSDGVFFSRLRNKKFAGLYVDTYFAKNQVFQEVAAAQRHHKMWHHPVTSHSHDSPCCRHNYHKDPIHFFPPFTHSPSSYQYSNAS